MNRDMQTSRTLTSRLMRPVAGALALALLASSCAEAEQDDFPAETTLDEEASAGQASASSDPECSEADPAASFEPDETTLGSQAPDIERIRDAGVLRVGVAQDTLLFGYTDSTSGALEGFDVEMAKLVSDALFGTPDNIELIPIQSSERIPKLQNGELDLVAKTMTITCERWSDINFSTIYYDAGQRLLVRTGSGIDDIADYDDGRASEPQICAEAETTSLANLEELDYVETVEVRSIADCLVLFQQSSVDGISTDDTILAGLAAQDPLAEVVGDDISSEPYGLGTRKEDVAFTRFVNAVLEQARQDGSWQAAYDEWLSDSLGEQTPPAPSYRTS